MKPLLLHPFYLLLLITFFLAVNTSVFAQVNGHRYVDASRASSGDGTTWNKAYKTLKEALTAANSDHTITEIHVAKGTYYPTGAQSGTDRAETFGIYRSNLAILGGYPSGGGERNWNTNPTILSGEINNTSTTDDNSYHVMVIAGVEFIVSYKILIEGFSIQWGRADKSGYETYNGHPIERNRAGGIAIYKSNSGIDVRNCMISGNYAADVGAAVAIDHSSPRITSSIVSGNYADYCGGIFVYNEDDDNSTAVIRNSTVVGNYSNNGAGGIRISGPKSYALIANSIVYGNSNGSVSNLRSGKYDILTSLVAGENVLIANNQPANNLPGNTDPLFVNHIAPQSGVVHTNGDYRLQATSPCIDKGNDGAISFFGGFDHDLANNSRIVCLVDMGAYESAHYPVIQTQPTSNTICLATNTSFSIVATNVDRYEWQVKKAGANGFMQLTNGGMYSGVSTANLNLNNVPANENGNVYRCVTWKNECASTTSEEALLIVKPLPPIEVQPIAQMSCTEIGTSFSVQLSNVTGLSYQWQYDDGKGGGFKNVPSGAPYTGRETATLKISTVNSQMNGYNYRAIVSGECGSTTSSSAKLTVHSPPQIAAQEFCNEAATVADLLLLGTDLKWYNSFSGGNALASTVLLSTGTYYVSKDFGSCETYRVGVNVTATVTPPPSGNDIQAVMKGASLLNLVMIGTDLKWYDVLEGGDKLPTSTEVESKKYYVSQTINGCESSRFEIEVKVFSSTTAYVKQGGLGSGTSWEDASGDLQAMINFEGIEQVWVGGGKYHPTHKAGTGYTDRDRAFVLKKGVKVYGGFTGMETSLNERDLRNKANVSILSGDFDNNDEVVGTGATLTITGNGENAYHVVIAAGDAEGVELNGFIITGGKANSSSSRTLNGKMIDCNVGGGLLVRETGSTKLIFSNLILIGNQAEVGGGISFWGASPVVLNTLIIKNYAYNMGSGTFIDKGSSVNLSNVTIAGNRAQANGGDDGLVIFGSNPIFTNSIIWGNSDKISNYSSSTPTYAYSIVQGVAASGTNLSIDPMFMDVANGDYRLQPCSPAINAGDPEVITGLDLNGYPRVQHGRVDMGAYETNSRANSTSLIVSTGSSSVSAYQEPSGTTWYGSDCQNLLLSLTSTGASPIEGITKASIWVNPLTDYVGRHYEIAPSSNTSTATGKVTLYFTQAEFDAYNQGHKDQLPSGPTDATGIANLRIEKRSGESSDGSGHPSTYTGSPQVIDPADEDIVWNASLGRWEVSFSVVGFSGFFAYAVDHVALPVTLVAFQAAEQEQNIVLSWQTSEELNASHFEIERSATTQEWTTLGQVEAMGDYRGTKDYQYVDALALASTGYYRLKMVDRDGSFSYSKLVSIDRVGVFKVTVYPNPVSTGPLRIVHGSNSGVLLAMYDLQGRRLSVPFSDSTSGEIIVDVSRLHVGVYVLQIRIGDKIHTEKVVVSGH